MALARFRGAKSKFGAAASHAAPIPMAAYLCLILNYKYSVILNLFGRVERRERADRVKRCLTVESDGTRHRGEIWGRIGANISGRICELLAYRMRRFGDEKSRGAIG